MTIESKVIAAIKFWMAKKRISQDKMAQALGINRSTLTHVLTNRTQITLDRLIAIADVLQINTRLLTDGTIDIPAGIVKLSNVNVRHLTFIALNTTHKWRSLMDDPKYILEQPSTPADVSGLSNNAFYTKVDTNLLSPIFSLNDTIIIDPDRAPKDGNYILATILRNNSNVIRQYYSEGNKVYLKAAENMPLETLSSKDIKIIGVIISRQINLV